MRVPVGAALGVDQRNEPVRAFAQASIGRSSGENVFGVTRAAGCGGARAKAHHRGARRQILASRSFIVVISAVWLSMMA